MTGVMAFVRDGSVLIGLHAVLVATLSVAVIEAIREKRRRGKGMASATIVRGDKSMLMLNTAFGVGAVVLALAVQVANVAQGYKVSLITFDYAALLYLFFFNSWFRNRLLRLMARVHED